MKTSKYEIVLYSVICYLFSMLFYRLIPFPITTVLGVIIIMSLLWIYIQHLTKRKALVIFYCVIITISTSLVTENLAHNFGDLVRTITALLLISLLSEEKEIETFVRIFDRHLNLILNVGKISCAALIIMLIIPQCYGIEASWGTSTAYFMGFTESGHIAASTCCLCLAMYLYGLKKSKFDILELLYLVGPVFAVFQSGARVYLICVAMALSIYYFTRLEKKQIKYLLFPLVIIALFYLIINSNLIDKFNFAQNGYAPDDFDKIDKFTSGRTIFWMKDLTAYWNSSVIYKLFGQGFYYIVQVSGHSGHNDIIHMLLGIGLVGCCIYNFVFINSIKCVNNRLKESNLKKMIIFLLIISLSIYIYAPMILNGIVLYQHLLYSFFFMVLYLSSVSKRSVKGVADHFEEN